MTSSPAPLVSVLVPAFNAEATLAETLRSALASSHGHLELVVVDDGSTDGTAHVAAGLAEGDHRIRLFRRDHRGVSSALNFGLAQCRGTFVARLDADDLWHPSKIAKQLAVFDRQPGCALVYSFVRYLDEQGRVVRDATPLDLAGPALCRCAYNGIIGGGSCVMVRRSVLNAAGGFDEDLRIWEDLLFHLRVAAVGPFGCVPEYLAGYRLRPQSSSNDSERALSDWRRAHKRIASEFPPVPVFVRRWSNARRLIELAERSATSGHFGKAAALVAECLMSDPARTRAVLAYRIHRRLRGRRSPPPIPGAHFTDLDPASRSQLSPLDAGQEGQRLRRFDDARDQRLRSTDLQVARRLGWEEAAEAFEDHPRH